MAEKKPSKKEPTQAERFRAEVERLIADGELNPIEADEALNGLVSKSKNPKVNCDRSVD